MKKKRVPFFTICALICAGVLFYLNNQESRETTEKKLVVLTGNRVLVLHEKPEHTRAEIGPDQSSTSHEQPNPEQERQFIAYPETRKPEHGHAPEPAQALATQEGKAAGNTDKNFALSTLAPGKKSGARKADHVQATALELSRAHITPTDSGTSTTDSRSKTTPESNKQTQKQILQDATAHPHAPEHTTAPAPSTKISQNISRTVTVKNGITPAMLSYAHWTGTYSPTLFEIEVNGSPLEQGAQTTITLDQKNNFTVSYRYSFMNGYKTGARKVTFNVDPEKLDTQKHPVELGFSWKNKWHVISDQATHEFIEDIK